MRISSSWLEQFVTVPEPEELAEVFEMAGIGVEDRDGDQFTLEVTSNRGDWLSAYGLAREIGAMTDKKPRLPHYQLEEADETIGLAVEIEDAGDCPRYMARILENVTVADSPQWIVQRLNECGVRSINNVVDITNLVMLEMGQPLHAFDADVVAGDGTAMHRIVVRRARTGEKLTTLDGVERTLSPEVLLIADAEKPLGIAGVMGGQDSEVTPTTKTIILESAHFAPARVRRGCREAGLASEASRRFERWVDPNGVRRAADRATLLLQEFAAATLCGAVDRNLQPILPIEVSIRVSRCNAVLGLNLSSDTMRNCLERLGLSVSVQGEVLSVAVPTTRRDLTREIDLIEEIARIHGYSKIPTSLPRTVNAMAGRSLSQRLEEKAKSALLRCGLTEVVTLSMQNEKAVLRAAMPVEQAVTLRNPLSEEFTRLRTSMLPSLLEVLQKNARRGAQIFELGKVYLPREGSAQPDERRRIAIAVQSELATEPHWQPPIKRVDFFWLRGIIETLLAELGAPSPQWRPTSEAPFHPGRCARISIDGQDLGILGEVHPEVAANYELPVRACIAQIDFDSLVRHLDLLKPYRQLPRFPSITRDLALILPESVSAAEVEATLRAAGGALLHSVKTFDVYNEPPIPPGHKSLALKLEFRAADRTLTDADADNALAAARAAAEAKLGAKVRA